MISVFCNFNKDVNNINELLKKNDLDNRDLKKERWNDIMRCKAEFSDDRK